MDYKGIAYSFPVGNNFEHIEVRNVVYARRTPRMNKEGDEERGGELKSITEGKPVI